MEPVKKMIDKFGGTSLSPMYFLLLHLVLFLGNHVLAMLCYQNFWINTALNLYYHVLSFWNGSCYYMEYFSKQYEKQLDMLGEMEKKAKSD